MSLKQVGMYCLLVFVAGLCKAQFPEWQELTHDQDPAGDDRLLPLVQDTVQDSLLVDTWQFLQGPMAVQSKQAKQRPVKKLTWHFPQVPEMPGQMKVDFELRQPTRPDSVGAHCEENLVRVVVKKDLFGTGEPINPSFLSLGGCAAVGEDLHAQFLVFESDLQACNSALIVTEDELVYTFTLLYVPEPLAGTPIVRTGGAAVGIECHYSRNHNVSSNALAPTWIPFTSTMAAEEFLVFSLRLMTDDWEFERPSNQYFLSELINIEASVMQFNHVPLRIFIDSCVATADPNLNSVPKYYFIENHGCLIDAKITGSKSRFMPRFRQDKLQLQLEAFRFQNQTYDTIYITCFLKTAAVPSSADVENKACSFHSNGWIATDADQAGYDQVCSCCDESCGFHEGRETSPNAALWWEESVPLGPIVVKELTPISQEVLENLK